MSKCLIFLRFFLVLTGLVMILSHCSPAPQKISVNFPLETSVVTNTVLAANSPAIQQPFPALQQQWWVTYNAQSYPLQVYIEPNLPHWKMVIVNNLGQRLVTLDSQRMPSAVGDRSHPLQAIYADLINAAHWSFWPYAYLKTNNQWEIREQAKRRDIYFSGILQASFETLEEANLENNNPDSILGRSIYKSYARKGHPEFEIKIQSSPAE